ncbi:cryptic plasmid protein A [Paraburkholderia bannensis]|nr:cryptic plasmid protein A [Paraburkholderia bannensis]RQM47084.1 cryptic plasmid protein A [Paraburkholderia bannensis]
MDAPNAGALDVLVENNRDRRTLDFLLATCGLSRVQQARTALPGRTRPYVSNIAKQLGVTIPDAVVITPREEGRRELTAIKQLLTSKLIVAAAKRRQ